MLVVHAIVIPWRWKWRLASRVTLVSLALALLWILWAAIDMWKYVGDPQADDDNYVGAIILFAVFSWMHLILFFVALCICLPFDRWKHNR